MNAPNLLPATNKIAEVSGFDLNKGIKPRHSPPDNQFMHLGSAFQNTGDLMSNERIKELERRITELKRRWPAHSAPPTMLQQLEELEEELEKELKKAAEGNTDAQADGPGGL